MRKDAKYIYPALEKAIVKSHQRPMVIAKALGMKRGAWNLRRYGMSDWKLGEMLLIRDLLAPNMTLDALFRREKVTNDGTV